jgi:HD-like signal output (HDOD) protein
MHNNTTTLDHSVLKRIRNLALFNDNQLNNLATRLEPKIAAPKQRIIGLGDMGDYSLYLLSGEAISRDGEGIQRNVQSESDGQLQPIAHIRPSLYNIETLSPVEYLEIPNDLLTELSLVEEADSAEIEVEIIEQSEEANRLTISLCMDISSGSISLPTMPDVVQKIQKVFADDDYDVAKITGLIQSDPSISAKLLKTANSALYRGSAPIETLQQAVVRMGMDVIRKQIMIYAASELFQSKSTGMQNRMQSLWSNCRKVSAFSRVLATRSGRFDPEMAQMAGLLSDLGIIAILDYAQKHSDLYGDDGALDQTIRVLHPQINGMLLYQWNLGDEIVTVGEESRNWFRNHRDDADICDLVLVARYYSLLGTPVEKTLPALSKMPAFLKLKLDFSAEDTINFIEESETEVAAVESMLGSI